VGPHARPSIDIAGCVGEHPGVIGTMCTADPRHELTCHAATVVGAAATSQTSHVTSILGPPVLGADHERRCPFMEPPGFTGHTVGCPPDMANDSPTRGCTGLW
jgi:hypothetical protein